MCLLCFVQNGVCNENSIGTSKCGATAEFEVQVCCCGLLHILTGLLVSVLHPSVTGNRLGWWCLLFPPNVWPPLCLACRACVCAMMQYVYTIEQCCMLCSGAVLLRSIRRMADDMCHHPPVLSDGTPILVTSSDISEIVVEYQNYPSVLDMPALARADTPAMHGADDLSNWYLGAPGSPAMSLHDHYHHHHHQGGAHAAADGGNVASILDSPLYYENLRRGPEGDRQQAGEQLRTAYLLDELRAYHQAHPIRGGGVVQQQAPSSRAVQACDVRSERRMQRSASRRQHNARQQCWNGQSQHRSSGRSSRSRR